MSDSNEAKPVEVFCPICGYSTTVKETDHGLEGLSREEKVEAVKKIQQGEEPIVVCNGCDDPDQTAKIMEVR